MQVKSSEDEKLISRHTLCDRWDCSGETLKRYEKRGILRPVRIAPRMLRYRLTDILKIEEEGK